MSGLFLEMTRYFIDLTDGRKMAGKRLLIYKNVIFA